MDILENLWSFGMEHVIQIIFDKLTLFDLQACQLVSRQWYLMVTRMWDHHEEVRIGRGWSLGNPSTRTIQCDKSERSVCTVSDIAVDESSFAVALGSSGKVELWDVRLVETCGRYDMVDAGCRTWSVQAVSDGGGVYAVDMNGQYVVTGGEDGAVKVWSRAGVVTNSILFC